MSILFDISDKLQDTESLISRLERELPNYPDPSPLLVNIRTLEHQRVKLESEFALAAEETGLEVCNYRMLPILGRALISGVGNALANYQAMFSSFFDALINGPKQTGKVGAETAAKTGLGLEYAYSGSIGFVLTVPREILLQEETPFEETIRLIFEVAHATKPEEVLPHAIKLGRAPIRSMFRWAEGHQKASLDAEILWRRGGDVQNRLLIQSAEFDQLQRVISQMSDEQVSTFEAIGQLLGADVTSKTFHFSPNEGDEIRGRFTDAIGESHPAGLPKRYKAFVRKTVKINYSTEDEEASYFLERLQDVSPEMQEQPIHTEHEGA